MKVTVPEELFRAKKSGALLPFFGAGVSAALGVPSWRGLLKEISKKVNCSDVLKERINALDWNTNFEELSGVASELMKASGDVQVFMNFLQEALRPEISGEMPERVKAISELRDGLPGLVTTNFDTVLEDYCGFTPDEVVYRDYEALLKRIQQKKFLFKIHGDPTKYNLIVFTKEQYETLENDVAYQEVLKQIFLQWAIIFVGYSITDTYILKSLEYLHRNHVDELEVFALLPDAEFELQKRLRRIGVRVIPYSVGTGVIAHSAVDAFLALLDSSDYIPAPESGFQGREAEINRITQALIENQAVLVEVVGPAGIGKTQLARAAAQNIRQLEHANVTFGTCIFVDLINKKGSNSLIYGIRDALGLSEEIIEKEEIFNEVVSRHALIIVDNVEDPLNQEEPIKIEFVDTLIHLCDKVQGNGALIITSRTALSDKLIYSIGGKGKTITIHLEPLNYEEARELFILESKADSISEVGEQVLQRLSAHPGSIRILGRRVAKLSDEGKENLFKNLLEDPEKASKAVINTTFEILPEDSRLALQKALAFPAGLSPEVARFKIGEDFTELLAPALQNGLLKRSGGRYRSIESIRQNLSSNELTQDTLLGTIDFYTKEIHSFQNQLKEGVFKPSNATFLLEEYGNISACANFAEKFDHIKLQQLTPAICIFFQWSGFLEDPTRWIRTVYASEAISSHDTGMLLLFADNLLRIGSPESNTLAERIYRRILEHYEKKTEASLLSRTRIMQASESLALLLMNVGGKSNLVEAENLFRNTLNMKKKYLSDSDEDQAEIAKTADMLANLLLKFQGEANLREAEILIRDAFAINKKLVGVDPRAKFNLARSMISLSKLLQRYGKAENMSEIEALNREALRIHREMVTNIPGAKTALVQSLTEYANVLAVQRKGDKYQEIEEMYREAIKIQRELVKTQPFMRRGLAFSLYSLAIHLRMKGEEFFDEFEALQREALTLFKDISENMPSALESLAYTLIQLATFLRDYGDKDKLSESESLLRQALSISNKVEEMGESASKLKIQSSFALAQLLRVIGGVDKLEEAELLYRQIINKMKEEAQYLPRERLGIASMNIALAELVIIKGGEHNRTEAMTLYKESLKIQEEMIEKIPELQINLAIAKMNYANFLHQFGREDLHIEIFNLYQDALKTTKALLDSNPLVRGPISQIMMGYANFLASRGGTQNFKLAESLVRESLEIKRNLAQESNAELLNLSNTLISLGGILKMRGEQKDLNEAEQCYREALSIQKELIKISHGLKIDTTPAATDLAHILINLGGAQRFAEAENLLRETLEMNKEQMKINPMAETNLARTMSILADLLNLINVPEKLIEAEGLYKHTLEIYRKWIKEMPLKIGDLGVTLLNLASLLSKAGDLQKVEGAETYLIEALTIFKENVSKIPHAEMNLFKTDIALVDLYIRLGKKEKLMDAETLSKDALTHLKKQSDMKGVEILIMDTSYKLANILLSFGGNQKYREAELVLRETLAYANTHLMEDPRFQAFLARIKFGLAFILTNLRTKENLVEAEEHFKYALNIQRKFAPNFPEVKAELLKTLFSLAELSAQFRNKDKLIQSEILYREVLHMLKTDPHLSTTRDSDYINIAVKLADVLQVIGGMEKFGDAEELLEEALAIIRKMGEKIPDMQINIAHIQYKLARALNSQLNLGKKEKMEEIEGLIDRAIKIYEEEMKKTPGLLANLKECIFLLAATLHIHGPPEKYEKAESLYKELLNLFRKMEQSPEIKASVLRITLQLAELYEKMNQFDDAEPLYREALTIARVSAESKPENTDFLGRLAYNYALFLKKYKASSAKEEISSLLQEAKFILHKAGKEDLVKRIEETEKPNS